MGASCPAAGLPLTDFLARGCFAGTVGLDHGHRNPPIVEAVNFPPHKREPSLELFREEKSMGNYYDRWLKYWDEEQEERKKARICISEDELEWVRRV